MDWQIWGPPLVVLSIGIAVGLGLALTAGGQRAIEDHRLARREDLAAEKASLLEQIRSLDADRDKLGEDAYARMREELVGMAAKVLAELEALDRTPAAVLAVEKEAAQPSAGRANPLIAGFWAAGLLLFFGLLAVFLGSSSTERVEGGSMTGGSEGRTASVTAEVDQARADLEEDANDLEAIHTLTYNALLNRELDTAMQLVERARAIDPDAPDLHVHLAILQLTVGMLERADEELARAIEQRPEWGRPRLWRGLVRLYDSKPTLAIVEIEAALALGLRVDEQSFARQLLADARNPRPAAPAASAAASAPPSGPMYAGAGGGAMQLAGTVDRPAGDLPDDRVVFLVVYRNAEGKAPPPPVATARLTVADLPFTFKFEAGHSMTGGPWPEQVWIRARVDADGRPGPASADDIDSVLLGPLTPGTDGLQLQFP